MMKVVKKEQRLRADPHKGIPGGSISPWDIFLSLCEGPSQGQAPVCRNSPVEHEDFLHGRATPVGGSVREVLRQRGW